MDGRTAIARILKAEGVELVTCYPANPLIDACAAEGIRTLMPRTERTAVAIADGYSRSSFGRKIGVCLVQHGPGTEHAFPGVAQAYSDSSPILLLPGGVERRQMGVPPNFSSARAYGPVTKWAETVLFADRIPMMFRRAFTFLRTGRPGPVVLEVPTDVMAERIEDGAFQYTPVRATRSMADPAEVREAVRALLAARLPLLHIGQGVHYAGAWEEVRELAELLAAPVMTTLPGKSAFPEDHPLFVGSGGRSGPKPAAHFLKKCDLILAIGASMTKTAYGAPLPPGKRAIQVTVDERDINKDYPVDYALVGDARLVVRQMIEEIKGQAGPSGRRDGMEEVAQEVRAVREEWLREWLPRLTSDEVPINPYRVVWDLVKVLDPRRTIITHDSGNPRDQLSPFYPALAPGGYIGWGKSTQLGYSLGLAMGAKLANPDRLAVAFMGDGAFGMCGMDLETAVRERIPILVVLLNNGLLGGYEKHVPIASARFGTRFLSGDYSKVAEGLGGYTERVEKPADLVPALRRCIAQVEAGRPALLEVMTTEDPVLSIYW